MTTYTDTFNGNIEVLGDEGLQIRIGTGGKYSYISHYPSDDIPIVEYALPTNSLDIGTDFTEFVVTDALSQTITGTVSLSEVNVGGNLNVNNIQMSNVNYIPAPTPANSKTTIAGFANGGGGGTENAIFGDSNCPSLGGTQNVIVGSQNGTALTVEANNIIIGRGCGNSTVTSDNIIVGNTEAIAYNKVIAIGVQGLQNSCKIAGISGATSTAGIPVLINTSGVLGTTTSSRRFKKDIIDLPNTVVDNLYKLSVRQFKYIEDEQQEIQYGLIAEEVADVMPELVVYETVKNNRDDDKKDKRKANDKKSPRKQPQTVHYERLITPVIKAIQDLRCDHFLLKDDLKKNTHCLPIHITFAETPVLSKVYATVAGGRFIYSGGKDHMTANIKAVIKSYGEASMRIYCITSNTVIAETEIHTTHNPTIIKLKNVVLPKGDNIFDLQMYRENEAAFVYALSILRV